MLLSLLKSLHPYVRFSSLPKIFITYRERGGVNGLKEEGGERIGYIPEDVWPTSNMIWDQKSLYMPNRCRTNHKETYVSDRRTWTCEEHNCKEI